MQTQQTKARWGTAGNGISGGLQMCQLECELRVSYANERLGVHVPKSPAVLLMMLYGLLIQGKGEFIECVWFKMHLFGKEQVGQRISDADDSIIGRPVHLSCQKRHLHLIMSGRSRAAKKWIQSKGKRSQMSFH